jgi:uncharacterized protein YkwD
MKTRLRNIFGCSLLALAAFLSLPPVAHADGDMDSEESAFLTLINNFRAQNGVGPLQLSAILQNSAHWMSNDMAAKDYASHTDSLGRDVHARITAFNYRNTTWGENIAGGMPDAQSAFAEWKTACDPDASGACTYAHRNNMLKASFKVIGIGRAYRAGSTYRWYWTTDFGGL